MSDQDKLRGLLTAGFERLGKAAEGDARKLAMLARTAKSAGHADRAYPLAKAARAVAPDDPEIAALTRASFSGEVPPYHLSMLRDEPRNRLYAEAITRVIQPGDRVLDIGSGSGLLAMIAARAGAGHVYSCEMNPAVADVAAEIVALNGLDDRITILPRNSGELDAERDLAGRVDVIISEVFSDDVIGEGVLATMTDAVPRLLKPGGRVLPGNAQIVVALASHDRADPAWLRSVEGFDLSPFAQVVPWPVRHGVHDSGLTLRSASADLFDFDLAGGGPWRAGRASLDLIADGGRIDGVSMWLRFQLDGVASYENRPAGAMRSHWQAGFYPFPAAITPPAATPIRIHAAHDERAIWLWPDTP